MGPPIDRARRVLILTHRYLGIPLSMVFMAWFASGIVMMYTGGMPADSADERKARRESIRLDQVHLSPAEAARAGGIWPATAVLRQLGGRPVWHLGDGAPAEIIVYADDGSRFDGASPGTGAEILRDALSTRLDAIVYADTITTPDQWTLTERRHLPMLVYRIEDSKGTWAYVSSATGEIVLTLTRAERLLAWAGAIPHWFYLTSLRTNQPAWYWTVVVLSAAGCVMAVLGLILAVTQFRRTVPFSLRDSIRYRGLMRWHYFSGATFGILVLTFTFSGLLSMQPFDWMNIPQLSVNREAMSGGALDIDDFPWLPRDVPGSLGAEGPVAEVELIRVAGRARLLVQRSAAGPAEQLLDATTLAAVEAPLPQETIVALVEAATDTAVKALERLDAHDGYYYGRGDERPLPVVRLELDDPDESWVYVDPLSGRPRLQNHRHSRLERWLFNGLHSLDFPYWYDHRLLRDVVMILLSVGGLATSGFGLVLGVRRVTQALRQIRCGSH